MDFPIAERISFRESDLMTLTAEWRLAVLSFLSTYAVKLCCEGTFSYPAVPHSPLKQTIAHFVRSHFLMIGIECLK